MHPRSLFVLFAGLSGVSAAFAVEPAPRVQVIYAPAWSQGDLVREGAGEFMILMEVARLTQVRGGLVGVGDRRGLFGPGAEQAMAEATLRGVAVVKLAPHGRVLPAPHGRFLDGGSLSEKEACAVLERCVATHGALPVVGERAGEAQLAELRERLKLYQNELTLAAGSRLAAR